MNVAPTLSARAWAEMLLLASIWGATFFFTALSLREVGPLTTVAFRLGIGAAGLWLLVFLRGELGRVPTGLWLAFAMMGLLNNVVPFSLITWGQQFIQSGLAAILNASTGVIGVVVAAVLLVDERMTPRKLLGALTAFFGVIVTIGPAALVELDAASLGQWAVIGAALSYSLAGVWARRRLRGVTPLISATGMVSASALMLWPMAIATEGLPSMSYGPGTWLALAYQGVLATTGAYLLYYSVLARAGSGNLMLVTLLLPPIAILLGVAFLQETLLRAHLLGFGIIGMGLVIVDGRLWRRLHSGAR